MHFLSTCCSWVPLHLCLEPITALSDFSLQLHTEQLNTRTKFLCFWNDLVNWESSSCIAQLNLVLLNVLISMAGAMSVITRQAPSELNVESACNINVCTTFFFLFHRMTIVNFNLWSDHALSICGLFLKAHVAEHYIHVAWTYSDISIQKLTEMCKTEVEKHQIKARNEV